MSQLTADISRVELKTNTTLHTNSVRVPLLEGQKSEVTTQAIDQRDPRAGKSSLVKKVKPATSKTGVELRARGLEQPFALDFKTGPTILATGKAEVHQFTGGTGTSTEALPIHQLPGGRILLENAKTDYSRGEDVILSPDKHGGYRGTTSTGEWNLSPADRRGLRELYFSPYEHSTPIISHLLGDPRPLADLAPFDGSKINLRAAPSMEEEPAGTKPRRLQLTVDISGDALGLKFPDGTVKKLSARTSQGAFADSADSFHETITATYDPEKAIYRLYVRHPEGDFVGELGPITKAEGRQSKELLAFSIDRGEISTHRASLSALPKNKLMLRFSDADGRHPTVIYFNARTGKGEWGNGRNATISKPDRHGERTVLLNRGDGIATIIKLQPYDPKEAVRALANKTASIEIYAPKSRAPNGDPSSERVKQTFTLRFGAVTPGGGSVPVKIDGITWPEDMVAHPTERGDLTINLSGTRWWLHPTGPGQYEALAEWTFQEALTRGTFLVHDQSQKAGS